MLENPDNKKNFSHKFYQDVRMLVLYDLFIEYGRIGTYFHY